MLLVTITILSACRSKKNLPEGAPAPIKQKDLLEKIDEAATTYDNIRIKAVGNLKNDGQDQGFRIEVRMLPDSLIWVDLADPVLGIKVVRVLITPDSIFMINRIDREYFKGDISVLQERFGVEYGFRELQNALSGNLVFDLTRDFKMYLVPGYYLLSSADPSVLEEESDELRNEQILQAYIDPVHYKAMRQIQFDQAKGESYALHLRGFEMQDGGIFYPQIIELIFGKDGENNLRLAVKRVDKNDPDMGFPFNIPADYAEMR